MHSASFNSAETYAPYSTGIGYNSKIYERPLKCISLDETKYELTVDAEENLSGLTGKEIIFRAYNKGNIFTFHKGTIASITGNVIKLENISLGAGDYAYKLFPEPFAFVPENSVLKSSANFSGGHYSIASARYTFSHGNQVMSAADGATIFGKYGNLYEAFAFALANGNSLKEPGLAFKVLSDGSVHADAEYTTPCADYAEFFEWEDGNPDGEDRAGYFVKLKGEKIVKCDEFDIPLGIVSATPAIIGDSGELHWKDKYVTDDFGRIQYHDVLVPAEYDEENNLISEEHMERQPIINPEWDNTKEYIPRKDRTEWSPVGVLGKLIVYDDGTLQSGDICRPGNNGIAVKSIKNGYPVLKRVSKDKVLVWFKE